VINPRAIWPLVAARAIASLSIMSSVALSPPSVADLAPRSIGLRLGALFGPSVFGVTAASVALPQVASALRVSPVTATWVLTGHALALGVGTALFGRVADVAGARRTLFGAVALLGAGAVTCLLAPSLAALVAGRLALAAGSGGLVAAALALTATLPAGQRPEALGWFGMTIACFAAGATLAGGAITEVIGWRLTLVLPALAIAAIPACLPLTALRAGSGAPLDLTGAALLAATASATVVVIQAHALRIPLPIAVAIALVAAVCAVASAKRSRARADAFVPRALAVDRRFVGACVTGFGVYAAFFAVVYVTPQILHRDHGWDVLAVGAALLPGAVVGAALSRGAAPLADRVGGPGLLAAVSGVFAATLAVAGAVGSAPVVLLVAAAAGFAAFAVTQVVLTRVVSAHVPAATRGAAVGLLNLSFFIGGATGTATTGALADSVDLTTAVGLLAIFPLLAAVATRWIR
jgi:DHA2 family metal-tetracycline-proton antiporter-like MFS transporter